MKYAELEKFFSDLQATVADKEKKVKATGETVRVLHENKAELGKAHELKCVEFKKIMEEQVKEEAVAKTVL